MSPLPSGLTRPRQTPTTSTRSLTHSLLRSLVHTVLVVISMPQSPLAGATRSSFLGHVKPLAYAVAARPPIRTVTPPVPGTIDDFMQSQPESLQQKARLALLNKVRVCPTCGKPNGYTMVMCNSCQTSLHSVALSSTPNLFTAFALGIERGPRFPLTVSLRHETADALVFDDPLALSPLHFCAVPTTAFIPDWRYLLLSPKEGLLLSQTLMTACHGVATSQFFEDSRWRSSLLSATAALVPERDMIGGYNFPPSQNQLHIQYMLPCFMPHQFMMFLRGVHFTHNRFFPIQYVHDCLARLAESNTALAPEYLDKPVEELVEHLKKTCGVDYDAMHSAFLSRVERLHCTLANWTKDHFEGEYTAQADAAGSLQYQPFAADQPASVVSEPAAFEMEKKILQNYGVAYTEDGAQPSVSVGYYSFATTLAALDTHFVPS